MSTSNQTNKRITVVIANKNYGRYLKQCIDSAKNQTLKPNIIAIFDDGSNDNSSDFKSDVDIFMSGPEGHSNGPSFGRNRIIEATINDTDIYAILDADDYWDSKRLEKCVKEFDNTSVGAVYTDNYLLNENSGLISREFRESFNLHRLIQQNYIHSGCLIRKEVLLKTGIYTESMRTAEDWDLWLRIAKVSMFKHVPQPLVTARVHINNSTYSVNPGVWQENWRKISERIKELYG